MSDNLFNNTNQELQRLAQELGELRLLAKEIAATLSRIESRAKRAFPLSFPKRAEGRSSRAKQSDVTLDEQSSAKLFDELVDAARGEDAASVSQRLASLGVGDLGYLQRFLGAPMRGRATRKSLTGAIVSRIRESLMLSKRRESS